MIFMYVVMIMMMMRNVIIDRVLVIFIFFCSLMYLKIRVMIVLVLQLGIDLVIIFRIGSELKMLMMLMRIVIVRVFCSCGSMMDQQVWVGLVLFIFVVLIVLVGIDWSLVRIVYVVNGSEMKIVIMIDQMNVVVGFLVYLQLMVLFDSLMLQRNLLKILKQGLRLQQNIMVVIMMDVVYGMIMVMWMSCLFGKVLFRICVSLSEMMMVSVMIEIIQMIVWKKIGQNLVKVNMVVKLLKLIEFLLRFDSEMLCVELKNIMLVGNSMMLMMSSRVGVIQGSVWSRFFFLGLLCVVFGVFGVWGWLFVVFVRFEDFVFWFIWVFEFF